MNFTALVGRGNTGLREVFKPGALGLSDEGDTFGMYSVVGESANFKWRVWVPPGTRSLQGTLFTFVDMSSDTPGTKALMRMGQPPTGGPNDVTPANAAAVDLRNVLAALVQGAEVPCFSPASAGNVKLSDGGLDSPVVVTTGQWLYIDVLQAPGNRVFEIVIRITIDKAQYLDWYAGAIWDDYGNPLPGTQVPVPAVTEQYLLGRLLELKMVEPLGKLCKAGSDVQLIAAAKASGLWDALLRFAK